MSRPILPEDKLHPAIREVVATNRVEIIREVEQAIAKNTVVVVGMGQNPFPKKVRNLLDRAGIAHTYLEYGSYVKDWRRRNALKMWTGWPTFPMVFVRGVLVGGYEDTKRLADSGELAKLVAG